MGNKAFVLLNFVEPLFNVMFYPFQKAKQRRNKLKKL